MLVTDRLDVEQQVHLRTKVLTAGASPKVSELAVPNQLGVSIARFSRQKLSHLGAERNQTLTQVRGRADLDEVTEVHVVDNPTVRKLLAASIAVLLFGIRPPDPRH